MIRWLVAVAVLIVALWIAATYPDLAGAGVVGLVAAYIIAPGKH